MTRSAHEVDAESARQALWDIVEILYPEGDPDSEWSSDELAYIARILDDLDLVPA
jgi:hypothetical protein